MAGANVSVTGGDALKRKLDEIRRRFEKMDGVYVGVPAAAGNYETGESIVSIAAINEFGAGNIPERSFLRVPLLANRDLFQKAFRELMPKVAQGDLTLMQALDQIGARAAAVSQEAISAGIAPPNAPSTIRAKKSSKPLIDTGRLRQSITWVVRDKEDA